MESRGPPDSASSTGASARRPPTGGVARPGAGGPKAGGVSAPNGAGEDAGVKGTARLAGLRLHGAAGDASSSIVITAVRQLEQRLESERRHTERQIQRLERQVEELMNVPPAGGRMAELQGYVDGLSETVQTLMRRSEEPALSARGMGGVAASAASPSSDSAALASLGARLGAVEARQGKLDRATAAPPQFGVPVEKQLRTLCAPLEKQLLSLGDHVRALERDLSTRMGSLEKEALQSCAPADDSPTFGRHRAVHSGVAGEQEFCIARGSPAVEVQDSQSDRSFVDHAARDDLVVDDDAHDDCSDSESDCEGFSAEELTGGDVEEQVADVCEQVDELDSRVDEQLRSLHDRLMELEGRMQDNEANLQEIQLDQDLRQETGHIGEQSLRLAVRMQRLERGGLDGAMSVDVEEVNELRSELGEFSEQLVNLASRLSHAERGLSGVAEAFGRVCEELAQLRSARSRPARSSLASSCEQAEGQDNSQLTSPDAQASSKMSQSLEAHDTEELPIEDKVVEMDRNFNDMAQVVWDLRKQVSLQTTDLRTLRTSFASLQTSVLGEEEGLDG